MFIIKLNSMIETQIDIKYKLNILVQIITKTKAKVIQRLNFRII
jgi:hypothetical protein